MAAVDILMATYNGGKYIAEQIDSILAQTFTDWRLLIRDDGSTDDTLSIIADYESKYPGKIQVIHDDAVCKSATRNFFELLRHAEADYVMFCDQDDVWLPYKIQITYDYMMKAERENPGKPVLVFTGLQVVDAELRSLDYLMSLDFGEKRYTFTELLMRNCAAGCTQMMNRECYGNLGGFQEGIRLHDWWTMLYAAAFGVVVRVPMALALYRQHGNNAIGAVPKTAGIATRIIWYITHPFARASKVNYYSKSMLIVFHERFAASLSPDKLSWIESYLAMFGGNIFTRFKAWRKFRDFDFMKIHSVIKFRVIFLGAK
ncbi:MAG: glycosyltransferase family 2 protein [Synergistaceae bacterium]|nr:glycosyltransferase family 2 protein [Synergistaceae bacterium]